MRSDQKVLFTHQYDDDTQLKLLENDRGRLTWLVNNQIHLEGFSREHDPSNCLFGFDICEHLWRKPPRVLVAGLGLGETVNTLARKLEEGDIDVVECAQEVIDYYKKNSKYSQDPKINLIKNDFYDYILDSDEGRYDSVFMQLDFAGCSPRHREYQLCKQSNSRFYTREFFKKVYSVLKKDSLLIFDGISGEKNIITPMLNDCGFQVREEEEPYWRPEIIDINRVTWYATK